MNLLKKLYFFTWNIGFLNLSEEEFLARKSLGEPVWLKHGFRDRFFADPFFLSTDGKIAKVLVEELIFSENKGRLVCLTCDMETGALLERKVVLELLTHLSYPQIIREKSRGGVWLIPENAESGSVNAFIYDEQTDTATFYQKLIDGRLVDVTFLSHNGKWWCFANYSLDNENLRLYWSDKFLGPYEEASGNPVISDPRFGRCGGAIFSVGGRIFRPGQNSLNGYGTGLEIREITELSAERGLVEQTVASLPPFGGGLHTINFSNGKCVIDGQPLQFAPVQKILFFCKRVLRNKLGRSS